MDAPAPSPIDTLIADLDAADWSVRQRATEALMLERGVTLEALAQAHNAPDASLEARQRLKQVLQHRLLAEMLARFPEHPNGPAEPPDALGPAEPREAAAAWQAQLDAAVLGAPPDAASLGIMHPQIAIDAVPDREGVEVLVLDTLPGFPAYPVLRPGDAIVRFAGNPLPAAAQPNQPTPINDVIQRHKAGDTVPLRIVRDGHEINLQVTLASLAALRTIYASSNAGTTALSAPYQQALDQRLAELLGDPAK